MEKRKSERVKFFKLGTRNEMQHLWVFRKKFPDSILGLLGFIPPLGSNLLVAGGFTYSAGIVFYLLDTRLHFGHAVWHGFVTVASALHFFSVLIYET